MRAGISSSHGVKEHTSVLVPSPNHLYYTRSIRILQGVYFAGKKILKKLLTFVSPEA